MDKFENALALAKEGCSFLPLVEREKFPARAYSFKTASTDPADAETWFRVDNYNLGIVPGLDVIVLDIDPRNGGEVSFAQLETDFGILPSTIEVVTGSGGFHRYYRLPSKNVGRLKAHLAKYPGIDFKGPNGHLVGPGSLHPNGRAYYFREGMAAGTHEMAFLPEKLLAVLAADSEFSRSSETMPHASFNGPKPKAAGFLAGCAWADDFLNSPSSVTEPQWFLAGNLLAHCDDGREVFHQLSKPDIHRYNAGDTDAKFNIALTSSTGPTLCGTVEGSGFDGCLRCPFHGLIKSPISLAYETREVAALQREYAYDTSAEGWRRLRDCKVIKPAAFNDTYRHLLKEGPHAALVASKRTRKVDRTVYTPGEPRLIYPDGQSSVCNSWRDTGCSASLGKHDVFDAHLAYLFPEPAELEHALNCLAHLVQRPGQKIKHAFLLIGGQGTGKSFIERLCTSLYGTENVRKSDAASLAGNFRAKLTDVQVLLLGEMMLQDKVEAYNATKELISEETIQVDEKYVRAYEAMTPRLIITSSNHLRPINIEPDDRRWFIVHGPVEKQSREYYDKLYDEAFSSEIEAFKNMLMTRDLGAFSANSAPPITAAKGRIALESKSSLAQSFIEWIEDGSSPFEKDLVSADDIAGKFAAPSFIRGRFASHGIVTPQRVVSALKAAGAAAFSNGNAVQMTDKSKKRLWIIRNHQLWLTQTNEAARAHLSGAANTSLAA
ncbi:bifunctional DNA primase/polymerase [Rhizobium sp. Leaf384]|uniref:bifunctional DNA primase/polymerase n=1 Tax=Rhizobium sp. Leaf384 TaxID=1736358 RepID=UPI000B2551B3|nr:bifunctional DNA primase/polymerase [Rhizobium sp. Leaf384]